MVGVAWVPTGPGDVLTGCPVALDEPGNDGQHTPGEVAGIVTHCICIAMAGDVGCAAYHIMSLLSKGFWRELEWQHVVELAAAAIQLLEVGARDEWVRVGMAALGGKAGPLPATALLLDTLNCITPTSQLPQDTVVSLARLIGW